VVVVVVGENDDTDGSAVGIFAVVAAPVLVTSELDALEDVPALVAEELVTGEVAAVTVKVSLSGDDVVMTGLVLGEVAAVEVELDLSLDDIVVTAVVDSETSVVVVWFLTKEDVLAYVPAFVVSGLVSVVDLSPDKVVVMAVLDSSEESGLVVDVLGKTVGEAVEPEMLLEVVTEVTSALAKLCQPSSAQE